MRNLVPVYFPYLHTQYFHKEPSLIQHILTFEVKGWQASFGLDQWLCLDSSGQVIIIIKKQPPLLLYIVPLVVSSTRTVGVQSVAQVMVYLRSRVEAS